VNLTGPFLLLKNFLPAMKKAGKGLIINIPGVLGKFRWPERLQIVPQNTGWLE
jgi:NAD(P)-dependent dehydrogenase (short-subunit alcohol dehydrogenase family)